MRANITLRSFADRECKIRARVSGRELSRNLQVLLSETIRCEELRD